MGTRTFVAALGLALLLLAGCSGGTTGEPLALDGGGDALVWGDGSCGVVLAHGASYDAASWEDQAVALADAGATVVAVEELDTAALEAAVRWLRAEGSDSVALVGASAGADAVLAAPGLGDELVLLSPNQEVDGLGPEEALYVASQDEPRADVARTLAAETPDGNAELLLVAGSAHAQGIFETGDGPRVLGEVIDRLGCPEAS